MNPTKKIFSLFVLASVITLTAAAQCKSLVKANLPKLAPYTHNGQLNSASLPEGGVADFKISCYTGLTYRLTLAADALLGKVTFRVLDEDNNEIYNSATGNGTWDFNVGSSQDITVEISVPLSQKSLKGCVALLVGFRQPSSNAGGVR